MTTDPEINPADIKPGMVIRAEWCDSEVQFTATSRVTQMSDDKGFVYLGTEVFGTNLPRWFLVADVPKPEPTYGEFWMVEHRGVQKHAFYSIHGWSHLTNAFEAMAAANVTPLYRMELHREGEARPTKDEVLAAITEAAGPVNSELNYDGSEDPLRACYVEGFRDAHAAVASLFDRTEVGR